MGYITRTVEVDVDIYLDDLDEDEKQRLGITIGCDLNDPHVDAMVRALQVGDRESVFQAAREWIRANSQVCV